MSNNPTIQQPHNLQSAELALDPTPELDKSKSQSYHTTDGQSASLSWYQAIICDARSILFSLPRKLFTNIRSSF
jgi:hypothetical protein